MDRKHYHALRSGDPEALNAWFNEHVDALYAFVFFRVGKNADLAADATQETFSVALRRLADFDPGRGEMITWLRTLSRNVIRDLMRAETRALQFQAAWDQVDSALLAVYEAIESERLPDSILAQKETRELVTMAMANIPNHYREVLVAKYIDNRSMQVIAEMQNLTIDAVKGRLKRARAAFKETFLVLARTEVSA